LWGAAFNTGYDMSDAPASRRLAAILAADIAGYSALVSTDEEGTVRALKGHQAAVLPMVDQYGGRVIDTAGDGIMAEFGSVVAALRCALAIQDTMAERNAKVPSASRLQYRIGINLGDVIFDELRIYGDGINVAARLEALAEPGGICVSASVHEHSLGKVEYAYEDMGEQRLKNITRSVRTFRVRNRLTARPETGPGMLSLPDKPSIAVLPFTNMSGDPEQEYFSDGIAEDILTELSRLRWLFVTARNSSFTYKGAAVDVKQVSRELGVRYVLEGSVRRAGNRVRVTGQLIDATTGNHVWAERYDRDLADIFSLQDDIAQAVSRAIAPAISMAEQERAIRKPPESLSAWEAYHRGMWLVSKQDVSQLLLARQFFQRAVELDPNFAPAYTALAITYFRAAHMHAIMTTDEAYAIAEPIVRKAVMIDSSDANARALLAYYLLMRGEHQGAIDEAETALSLNPHCVDAIGAKAVALVFSGRSSEGRELILHYLKLSPHDHNVPARLAQLVASYYFDRDYEAVVRIGRQVLRQHPKQPHTHRWLVAALGQLGRAEEAKDALEAMLRDAEGATNLHVRRRSPQTRPADYEHLLEGLRKAGWKE
jgi:adenylate cyclase